MGNESFIISAGTVKMIVNAAVSYKSSLMGIIFFPFITIAVSGKIRNIIGAADFWQFTCYVKVYIGKSRISGTLLAVPEIFCISEAVTDCLLQGLNSIIISRSLITKFQYCT